MEINKLNNLLELFYSKYKEQKNSDIFLKSIKKNKEYSWGEVYSNIIKLAEELSDTISAGDRCLIISENRL